MRKILTFPQIRVAATTAVVRLAQCAAFGAALSVGMDSREAAFAQLPGPVTGSFSDSGSTSVAFSEVPRSTSVYQPGGTSVISNGIAGIADNGSVAAAQYSPTQAISSSLFGGSGMAGTGYGYDACSVGCDISWYIDAEALWLRREGDERFSLSRNTIMPDFDYELGGRFTVGRLLDCVNAWEGVYVGPFDWERGGTVTGAGTLQSNFFPGGGFTAADIDTFNNANSHTQRWDAELQSFELNRRWWSWDVLSTMIGIRYVDYQEDYTFSSTSAAGNGLYTERLDNNLIGAQVGGDLMFPVNLRTTVGFRGKGGVYANFAERGTLLTNDGTLLLNTGDDSVDIAGVIEAGIFGHYQLVPSIRLTAGYEFWYMPGIATLPEQSPGFLTQSSGTSVQQEDDLFLHGGSVGVEVLY